MSSPQRLSKQWPRTCASSTEAASRATSARARTPQHPPSTPQTIRSTARTVPTSPSEHRPKISMSSSTPVHRPSFPYSHAPHPTHTHIRDLWLAGSDCSSCQGMTPWDPSQSSSFKQGSTPVRIKYGSGTASGIVASDDVSMGAFTVPDQGLGERTSLASPDAYLMRHVQLSLPTSPAVSSSTASAVSWAWAFAR